MLKVFDPDSIPVDELQAQLAQPLSEMMEQDRVEPLLTWLNSGGSPSWSTNLGWTLLHFAAMKGNLGMVEVLLARGVEVDVLDNDEVSPLMRACNDVYSHGCMEPEVIRTLLANGADPERKDKNGWTALEYLNTALHPEDATEVRRIILDALNDDTVHADTGEVGFANATLVLSAICRAIRLDMEAREFVDNAEHELTKLREIVAQALDAYDMALANIEETAANEAIANFLEANQNLVSDAASGNASLGSLVLKAAECLDLHREAYTIIKFFS